jgi:DNA (cytosine-5)-methyltransferase 1
MAGKRKGSEDERYLWHEMLRAIQEVKPKYVIAENVLGITNIEDGLVFEQVWSDLEVAGYEVQPFVLPAASKGAPHQRQRIWIIAYRSGLRFNPGRSEQSLSGSSSNGNEGITTNTQSNGSSISKLEESESKQQEPGVTLTDLKVWGMLPTPRASDERMHWRSENWEGSDLGSEINHLLGTRFPSESPICGTNDGLPRELDGITFSKWRNQSIKGYGNAIVPQVALELFKVIQEIDNQLI